MSNVSNQQSNILSPPPYSTPFNVDFFLQFKSEGYFREHVIKVLSLPESVRNILMDSSTAEFLVDKLSPAFSLNQNQTTELTRILRDILLTDLFWGDFPKTVSARLQVSLDTANQIVKMTIDQLLAPALDDIKAAQREKFQDRINQSNNQTQQPEINVRTEGNVVDLRNRGNQ